MPKTDSNTEMTTIKIIFSASHNHTQEAIGILSENKLCPPFGGGGALCPLGPSLVECLEEKKVRNELQ